MNVPLGRPLATQLATFVRDSSSEALGPSALSWASMRVLDLIASTMAGLDAPSSDAVTRAMSGEASAEATIVGKGRVATAANAALINGTIAHAAEFDDDHRTATLHPGAVVIPAALAASELGNATGQTFLRAVILGYETMCRIGEAFLGRQFYRGFHPTGTCGVFGAAVAAGVAFDLDEQQLTHALGIAGTQACGLGEWSADGSWTKRLHPGLAARNGVVAALLAREGFSGPATILEGRHGFLRAYADDGYLDSQAITRGLGSEFRAFATAWKPYPCCRFAHGAVDLAIDAHCAGIMGEDIDKVMIRVFRTDILTDDREPASVVDAQFAVPYLVAVALHRGALKLFDFTEPAIRDPNVLRLARACTIEIDDSFTAQYPRYYPTSLTITLRTGLEWKGSSDLPRGDPEAARYADDPTRFDEDLRLKVAEVMEDLGLEELGDSLVKVVEELPEAPDLARLSRVLGVRALTKYRAALLEDEL